MDGLFKRRPRFEQNMNQRGLAFLATGAFAFIMANVFTAELTDSSVEAVRRGSNLVNRVDSTPKVETSGDSKRPSNPLTPAATDEQPGPTAAIIAAGAASVSKAVAPDGEESVWVRLTAQIMAIWAHTAVMVGLLILGYRHFGDIQLGIAMAALYLLLPCTASEVHRVTHVLPAALMIWAFVFYRKPILSGALLGTACGTVFFAIFLAPVWFAFYGRKRGIRFAFSMVAVAATLMATLVFTAIDSRSLTLQLIGTINWTSLEFNGNTTLEGLGPGFRIPLAAAFGVMLACLTIWPNRKSVEHLMAHSTAIVLFAQLWYPQRAGFYFLWYLPLMLLVVFRPKLDRLMPAEPALSEATSRPARLPADQTRTGNTRKSLFR